MHPNRYFFNKPTITKEISNDISDYISESIENNRTINIGKVSSLLNIKYFLLQKDFHQKYNNWAKQPEYYQSFLGNQKGIYLEKKIGNLYFYKNDYWTQNIIYSTSNAILIDKGTDIFQLVSSENFTINENVIFIADKLDKHKSKFIHEYITTNNNSVPFSSYKKISPVEYIIRVNASKPFFLVFF